MDIGQGRIISIVGAGVSGLAAARSLARLGYRVNIYERTEDPRREASTRAASGSVLISPRGRRALRSLGLEERVLAAGAEIDRQLLHAVPRVEGSGRTRTSVLGRFPEPAIAVPYAALLSVLLAEAERDDAIEIFFRQRCVELDPEAATLRFADPGTNAPAASPGDSFVASSLIIGADGPDSAVRRGLQSSPGFSFSQHYPRAVSLRARLLPTPRDAASALDASAAHVWSRDGAVVSALPRADGSWDCEVCLHSHLAGPDGPFTSSEQAAQFLREYAPELAGLDPAFAELLRGAEPRPVMTTRAAPWVMTTAAGAGIALLGAAAHASMPLLGLDVNECLEDAAALGPCLEAACGDPARALADFDRSRRPDADAYSDTLARTLSELRTHTDSRLARARASLERSLHEMFPAFLAPRTDAIAAAAVPIVQARKRAERLERVLRALAVATLIIALFVLVLLRVPVWPLLVGVVVSGWLLWEVARARPVRGAPR